MNRILMAFAMSILSSCTTTKRSIVAMKINDSEAHIAMGTAEVKPNDRILLFKNVCKSDPDVAIRGETICEKIKLGEGFVTRVLNENYSVIKVDPNVVFEEGTIVEKKKY